MTSNITYVRWQRDESRRGRTFAHQPGGHPCYAAPCVLCNYSLGSDLDGIQLIVLGPDPEDAETAERHDAGRWYTALAIIVHTACAAKLSDAEVEALPGELGPADPATTPCGQATGSMSSG